MPYIPYLSVENARKLIEKQAMRNNDSPKKNAGLKTALKYSRYENLSAAERERARARTRARARESARDRTRARARKISRYVELLGKDVVLLPKETYYTPKETY